MVKELVMGIGYDKEMRPKEKTRKLQSELQEETGTAIEKGDYRW